MKSLIMTLVLLFGVAGVAAAQAGPLGLQPSVGVFKPVFPMVAVDNGIDPSIELQAAPAVGVELDYRFHPWLKAYGGVSAVFSQLVHTSMFELQGPNPTSSRANLVISTLGMLVTPPAWMGIQPVLRLGTGTKWYDFNFIGLDADNALNWTGDVGLGLSVQQGAIAFSTEARWIPSEFDPEYLPIRLGNEEAVGQWQHDWIFQMGFRFTPTAQ